MKTVNDRLNEAEADLAEAESMIGFNTEAAQCFFLSGILRALLAFACMMIPGGTFVQMEVFDPKATYGSQQDNQEEGMP